MRRVSTNPGSATRRSGAPGRLVQLLVVALLCAIAVLLAEGVASAVLFVLNLGEQRIVAERLHTEHDPLLGWINRPDVDLPNLYGPGRGVRTNAQRFRNAATFPAAVEPGRKRWICAGDSFAFGYGVDNDDTWCERLRQLVPGLETVNMGQGGYGVDQAFLWYERDGRALAHDAVLFTFITTDFERMQRTQFMGHPKPRLRIVDGEIVPENVPVPSPGLLRTHLPRWRNAIEGLALVRVLKRVLEGRSAQADPPPTDARAFAELVEKLFASLQAEANKSGRTVVFVHLPTLADRFNQNSDGLRTVLGNLAREHRWTLVDLIPALRELPPAYVRSLFIAEDLPGFIRAAGHYNEDGNAFVAAQIVRKLGADPRTAHLLGRAGDGPGPAP